MPRIERGRCPPSPMHARLVLACVAVAVPGACGVRQLERHGGRTACGGPGSNVCQRTIEPAGAGRGCAHPPRALALRRAGGSKADRRIVRGSALRAIERESRRQRCLGGHAGRSAAGTPFSFAARRATFAAGGRHPIVGGLPMSAARGKCSTRSRKKPSTMAPYRGMRIRAAGHNGKHLTPMSGNTSRS